MMNIFRLPLNVLVVVGTRVTDLAEPETVFIVIASWFLASALLQFRLSASAQEAGVGREERDGLTGLVKGESVRGSGVVVGDGAIRGNGMKLE